VTDLSDTNDLAVRKVLQVQRAEVLARIREVQKELEGIVLASRQGNADDEHDPEGSTTAYERARVQALLAAAESNLNDVDRALSRLRNGEYSLCEGCHSRISAERLAALPAGRTCFECASRSERAYVP